MNFNTQRLMKNKIFDVQFFYYIKIERILKIGVYREISAMFSPILS